MAQTQYEASAPHAIPSGKDFNATAQDGPGEKTPSFDPGELAPWWATPYPAAKLSETAEKALIALCDLVGQKDVAARRWEVEQSWEARLYDRGYQYLLPRKGGGWIMPPFATDYNRGGSRRNGQKWYGYETNIYTTYGEIITAALTRDVPRVRFEPSDPLSDTDITFGKAATRYAKLFGKSNDLLDLQHQLVYYLRNDGRAVIVVNHVLDAQRFGREEPDNGPVVPETVEQKKPVLIYLVRHGETELNAEGKQRGRSEVGLDDRGEREVSRAADFLKDKGIKQIICSPVERAVESAQEISQELGLPVEQDDRWASLNIGSMAGTDAKQSAMEIKEYEDKPDEKMPGGESFNEFKDRIRDAFFEALSMQGPVAVVTHDSAINQVFRMLHGDEIPPDANILPGGVAQVEDEGDGTLAVRTCFPYVMPEPPRSQQRGAPRGAEIAEVFGKLEAKVPMNAQTIEDCVFLQVCKEYDIAYVKGMFPDKAKLIKPGSAGAGENELDRIARINAALALEASYVTGDSMVRDCTVQRTWLRPAFFMEIASQADREELMNAFPDGCLAVMAGRQLMFARNESMDDHCTVVHAFPGSGQNRIALCSKLLSLQKRVNNWIDLMNDYFIRCVPNRWFNSKMASSDTIKQQSSQPGAFIPYSADAIQNQAATGIPPIWVEPAPQPNPLMLETIQYFLTELPQLLSGALPSLFGANANTDTVGGIAIQRDQALGRLGTPWHAINVATARYFKQAVQLAARMRTKPICGMDGDTALRVEISELKGSILAFPESDANFPESWVQKQSRYQQMLIEAAQSPIMQGFLTATPLNMRTAVDMAGLNDLDAPEAEAWDKQMGEIEILLKQEPVPNVQKQQAIQQAEQMAQSIAFAHQQGFAIPDGALQQAQQAQQQAMSMPDFLPSIQPDAKVDYHQWEAQACKNWLNSPRGREKKYGSQQEQAGYMNVRLHMLAHEALSDQQPPLSKPPSLSINYKDLPPEAGAALLQREGLPANPMTVAGDRIAQEQMKHPSEV